MASGGRCGGEGVSSGNDEVSAKYGGLRCSSDGCRITLLLWAAPRSVGGCSARVWNSLRATPRELADERPFRVAFVAGLAVDLPQKLDRTDLAGTADHEDTSVYISVRRDVRWEERAVSGMR